MSGGRWLLGTILPYEVFRSQSSLAASELETNIVP